MQTNQGGKLSVLVLPITIFLLAAGIFLLANSAPLQAAELTARNVINEVNSEREKLELPRLTENVLLAQAAERKAQALLSAKRFAHTLDGKRFSDWIKETGYRYAIVGENLAIHFSDTEPLLNAWLASPTHKQNILHAGYTEIGGAIAKGAWQDDAVTIIVTVFAAPAALLTPAVTGYAAEPFVPALAGAANDTAAPLLTSNLEESYLKNIVTNETPYDGQPAARLSIGARDAQTKTAIAAYVTLALRVMLMYVTSMITLVALYVYAGYFAGLLRRLRQLPQHQ